MFPVHPKDTLYDGGGGSGSHGLSLPALQDSQQRMFSRTVNQSSSSHEQHLLQEKRQLTLREDPVHIVVNVCREDFPAVRAPISVTFFPTAAQEVWSKFLSDVSKTLGVEFIHSIRDRTDKAPVFRILRLQHGHDYLVRQRESSAVLEILNTGKTPMDFSWDVTKNISSAQKDLRFNLQIQNKVNERIHNLVIKPMTQVDERDVANRLLVCQRCDHIVHLICQIYLSDTDKLSMTKELSVRAVSINYAEVDRFEGKIDIVAIHRLAIEQINRIVVNPQVNKPLMVKQAIHYVLKVMADLVFEVDVVAMALKLLTDIMNEIIPLREKIFPCILDSIQQYAPPAPIHRPRRPKRIQNSSSLEYKFDSDGSGMGSGSGSAQQTVSWLAPKLSSNGPRNIGPFGIDMNIEVNKFTRYGQFETLVYDRSMNRAASNMLEMFAKEVELDENFRPITPRTKASRALKKKMDEEAEKKRKLELEEILRSQQETKSVVAPRNIIRNRDRLDHAAAKQAIDYANQNSQVLSQMITMAPDIERTHPQIKPQDMEHQTEGDSVVPMSMGPINDTPFENSNVQVKSNVLLEDAKATPMIFRPRSPLDGRGLLTPPIFKLNAKDESKTNKEPPPIVNPMLITVARTQTDTTTSSRPSSAVSVVSQREPQSSVIFPSLPSHSIKKKPKFKIKGKEEKIDSTDDEATTGNKKKWKGSRGEIGKAPPDQKELDAKYQQAARAQMAKMQEEVGMINIDDITNDAEKSQKTGMFSIQDLPEGQQPITASATTTDNHIDIPSNAAMTTDNMLPSSEDIVEPNDAGNNPSLPKQPSNQPSRRQSLTNTVDSDTTNNNNNNTAAQDMETKQLVTATNTQTSETSVKKKKKKLVLDPLPDVSCPIFRGLADQMKENVVLVQGFATLLQMILTCYGHREWAFKNNVLEEIAEVILVCPSIPKVLEYFMEIIHTLYNEGYIVPLDLHVEQLLELQQSDDYTMVLSTNSMNEGLNQNSMTSKMSGKVLECMSSMSMPFIGQDPNYTDAVEDKVQQEKNAEFFIQEITSQGSKRSINAITDKPEHHVAQPEIVIRPNPHSLKVFQHGSGFMPVQGRKKPDRNLDAVKSLGQAEFELRYVQMPPDCVIMALSMCAAHVEVATRHRDQARFWLEVFSDCTRDYSMLMRKGRNLCAL